MDLKLYFCEELTTGLSLKAHVVETSSAEAIKRLKEVLKGSNIDYKEFEAIEVKIEGYDIRIHKKDE